MNITSYFKSGRLKKRDLSDKSNNDEDYKKAREGSLSDSFAFNSTALEDVFTGSLQLPECGEILIECLRSVEQKMNEMIAMIKTTQESQFKGKMHMNKLQESVDFISAKFDVYDKAKKQKEEKKFEKTII